MTRGREFKGERKRGTFYIIIKESSKEGGRETGTGPYVDLSSRGTTFRDVTQKASITYAGEEKETVTYKHFADSLYSTGAGTYTCPGARGEPWTITFGGSLAGTNVDAVTGDLSGLVNDTVLRSQTFEYDLASQLISETDAGGATTVHTFDGLGREIATLLEDPDGVGELDAPLWQYSFDVMSNLVLVTDPLLNETAYEFDTLNRRTKIVDAELAETTFNFDAASNLLSLTDPELNTTT